MAIEQDSLLESAINRLKEKAGEFSRVYADFVANRQWAEMDPALFQEWQSIKSIADRVRGTIEWINSQVDSASNWLRGVFGLSGLQSLSAIPFIPIAYVTGAVAALVYVTNQMVEFNQKVALVRERLAPGSILAPSPGIVGETGNVLKWLIIGGALFFVVKPLLEKRYEKRYFRS